MKMKKEGMYKRNERKQNRTFSAVWLRSSVVSVLISLISDSPPTGGRDVKLIFLGGAAVLSFLFSLGSGGGHTESEGFLSLFLHQQPRWHLHCTTRRALSASLPF